MFTSGHILASLAASAIVPRSPPWLVQMWALSDLMIAIAFVAIPIAIAAVMRRRPDIDHRGVVTLFALFILICGVAHALEMIGLFTPIYPVTLAVKLITGVVSLIAAFAFFRSIPVLVRIPTPDRHDQVIEQLELALADLSQARSQLELRVRQRTGELNAANQRLARNAHDTVQRNRNLVDVIAALAQPTNDASTYPETFLRDLRGRINALVVASTAIMEQDDRTGADLEYIIQRQIEPLLANLSDRMRVSGPAIDIGSQGAQQLSLITHELVARFGHLGRAEQLRGHVVVSWTIERQLGRDAEFSFEWHESFGANSKDALRSGIEGDGTYTPEPLGSFSETLLRQIVPQLLDGKGRIEIAPATFIYRLTCPLAALDPPVSRKTETSQAPKRELAF